MKKVVDVRNGQKGVTIEERRSENVVVTLVRWSCGYIEVFNAKYTKFVS